MDDRYLLLLAKISEFSCLELPANPGTLVQIFMQYSVGCLYHNPLLRTDRPSRAHEGIVQAHGDALSLRGALRNQRFLFTIYCIL
jgi:hypothetical protein